MNIPLLSLFTSVILQVSAAFYPGIGHFMSIFVSLPVILAGARGIKQGITVYISSVLLIVLIQPLETPIFIFMTGLFGLSLGFGLHLSLNTLSIIIISSAGLGTGIFILVYWFGVPALGGIDHSLPFFLRVTFFYTFSVFYSLLWLSFVKRIRKKRVKWR